MSIKGLDQFYKALDQLDKELSNPEEVIEYALQVGKEEAQMLVPVDTGELSDSIDYKVEKMEGELFAGTDHAEFIEYGTSRMAAQPFMRPAATRMGKAYIDKATEWVKKAIAKVSR